jgi:hypothetical protein
MKVTDTCEIVFRNDDTIYGVEDPKRYVKDS